ncbi:MAG: protoporphyrinogen oxidase [Gemmatimonadetes bacterium]|nr:protoporphyrinogen oxidase [Gemmatimonadota bacterium]
MTRKRLVVVGGGMAGLAAAWTARRHPAAAAGGLDVLLLESGPQVGGKAQSVEADGWLVESGPSGFLAGRPELTQLIADAGLADDAVPANANAKRRFVYRAGKLREIVPNPVGFARAGILSPRGLLRLLAEPFLPARREGTEETVWEFTARRLGAEVADRLIMPMTLGIHAGDAKRLSLPAAFPRMAALEREYGGLIRGLSAKRGNTSAGGLTSFRGGMQTLPRALAARGGFQVRCGARVTRIERTGTQWIVTAADDAAPIACDALVLATEPWAAAPLLQALAPDAAAALDGIYGPPVAVVALGYAAEVSRTVPRGFGVLITRDEGYRMLGNLWDSHIFPARSPDGHLLMRVMLGGAVDPGVGVMSEHAVIALARDEVARMYGITASPSFVHAVQWPRAIAQYELGHLARVERIERAAARLDGLFIGGSGLHGVAFADAAASGVRCGTQAAEYLRR